VFGTTWAIAIAVALQSAGGAPTSPPATADPAQSAVITDPWPDERPLTHLFPNLFHDLVTIPSANSAVILAAGGAAAFGSHEADTSLANWITDAGPSSYSAFGDWLGNGWVQSGGAVATYALGLITHRPQVVHLGGDLIRAQALNAVLTTTIKVSAERTRPTGARRAFPSGHTSATFASAAVLHAHYGWRAGVPAYAAAAFVGWSRVRDRDHWLSDVAFGAAVGIISGRTVAARHQRRGFIIVPAATKGGAALTVTWTPG